MSNQNLKTIHVQPFFFNLKALDYWEVSYFFEGELANSIRSKTDIHFGLYHSLFEWYHPLYEKDKANNYSTQDFVRVSK